MGIRFYRRIRILPWVYLNLGKGGFSISVGPRSAKLTFGKRGVKGSVGMPGTGIRYETPYSENLPDQIIDNDAASYADEASCINANSTNVERLHSMMQSDMWK